MKADADHGFIDEGHVDERTLAIAERHLRELDEVAADIGGYVNLTSPNGSLVKPKLLCDEIEFPSGYSLLPPPRHAPAGQSREEPAVTFGPLASGAAPAASICFETQAEIDA